MRNKEEIENGYWDLENSESLSVRVECLFYRVRDKVYTTWWWSKEENLKSENLENEIKLEGWKSIRGIFISRWQFYFASLNESEIAIEWRKSMSVS